MTEAGASTELAVADSTMEVLLKSGDEEFVEWAEELEVDELVDAVAVMSHLSQTSALRAGWMLYLIRTQTPDGEWGQKVWEWANMWEVSERTVHRWMSAAQSHYGLELTPAQKNAKTPTRPDPGRVEGDQAGAEEPAWVDDEDDPFAGLALDGGDEEEVHVHPLLDALNDEAGWGEGTLPEPARGTPPAGTASSGAPPLLEPDPTWVAFTAVQIQAEHPAFGDQAASHNAKARWRRKIEQEPLDLLEELEMIYEAAGQSLPDSTIIKLHEAEESKAIKPDQVTEGKVKRGAAGPKPPHMTADKMLQMARQLHEQCFVGLKNGVVTDQDVAAILPHLAPMPYAVAGLKKMGEEAKARCLAANPSMEAKIAETQTAEPADDPSF